MTVGCPIPTPVSPSAPVGGPCVVRVERRAKRLHDMMALLAVEPARFARLEGGGVYADARRRCLSCASATDCLAWLDTQTSTTASPPEFCPNREAFKRAMPPQSQT